MPPHPTVRPRQVLWRIKLAWHSRRCGPRGGGRRRRRGPSSGTKVPSWCQAIARGRRFLQFRKQELKDTTPQVFAHSTFYHAFSQSLLYSQGSVGAFLCLGRSATGSMSHKPHHRRTGSAENLLTPGGEATTAADAIETDAPAVGSPSALSPALSDILNRVHDEDVVVEISSTLHLSPQQDAMAPAQDLATAPSVAAQLETAAETESTRVDTKPMPRWCRLCVAPTCICALLVLGFLLTLGHGSIAAPPPPPP